MKTWLSKFQFPWEMFAAFCLAAGVIYLGFLRAPLHKSQVESEAQAAINDYLKNASPGNLQKTVDALEECEELSSHWSCVTQFSEEKFLTALIANNHIETLVKAGAFDEAKNTQQVKAWSMYSGRSPQALLRKAEYLSTAGDFKNAFLTFKDAFNVEEKYSVAIRLLRLYDHFGCTDDVLIWSELVKPDYAFDGLYLLQGGTDYPKQPQHLSDAEIIEHRVNLRLGHFQDVTAACPVSYFFK